jgi:hypothetical protein
MSYVYSEELESKDGCKLSIEIFKESEFEFRPIVTATDEENSKMGFSERRSFINESKAMEYFDGFEDDMINEAIKDCKK